MAEPLLLGLVLILGSVQPGVEGLLDLRLLDRVASSPNF